MRAPLQGVRRLRDQRIEPGERWLFSAGFNVDERLTSTERIDCELDDLRWLSTQGARVAIVSHQGSASDRTARPLDHIASYLSERLGRHVRYVESPEDIQATVVAPGDIVVVGNSRLFPGETTNDANLARRFAQLGDRVACGGFSKAHRSHASNVGVLALLPGFAASSVVEEVERLTPWGAADESLGLAILGGLKKEKLLFGVGGLVARYRWIIPGGAVLNVLLRSSGCEIAASELGECGRHADLARALLTGPFRDRILLPERVIVAPVDGREPARTHAISEPVPDGWAIVDFVLEGRTWDVVSQFREGGGRLLVAGTPSRYVDGFTRGARPILDAAGAPGVQALFLGGDTVADLPWTGTASSGGGSALEFLANGTLPLFEALTNSPEGASAP